MTDTSAMSTPAVWSRRGILSCCSAALLAMALPAVTQAALASNYYVGNYQASARRGVVTVQLVERLPSGGYIGWTSIDGISYLGNITVNGNTVDVTWYNPSGSYQVPLGTIHVTASADGMTLTGSFRHGLRVGRCRLIAT